MDTIQQNNMPDNTNIVQSKPSKFKYSLKDIRILLPFLIVLASSLAMIISLLLPYATACDSYKEYLNQANDSSFAEIGILGKNLINISMVRYARIYAYFSKALLGSNWGFFYTGIVAAIGLFSLLALLFSIFKKPIPIMIFDVFAFIIFQIQSWDYTDRGIIGNSHYTFGTAYYVFYIASVFLFIGAIWLLVSEIVIKRKITKAQTN